MYNKIILLLIGLSLFLSSCEPIKPTYTKENFVSSIQKICKEEFAIDNVKAWLAGETAWIYTPQDKLIDKDSKLDEEIIKKINKVVLSVSRVLLSMKPRPQFYVIVASDIKDAGADLIYLGNVEDILRFQFEHISRSEFGKRNIYDAIFNPSALSDLEGKHINPYDIKLEDFLSLQIAQRINLELKENNIEVKNLGCFFKEGVFNLQYEKTNPEKPINLDINKAILETVSLVVKSYRFKDYSLVKLTNLGSGEKVILGKNILEHNYSLGQF
jgi:hypothetical protein